MLIGNVLSLITGIIAAGLYGNIGISKFFLFTDRYFLQKNGNGFSELVYINIVEDWLKGPRLMTPRGRIIWTGTSESTLMKASYRLIVYGKQYIQGWCSHIGH